MPNPLRYYCFLPQTQESKENEQEMNEMLLLLKNSHIQFTKIQK